MFIFHKMPECIPPLTKRYYITNDYENPYPEAFINSPRKRYVHVVGATVVYNVNDSYYLPKNIVLHADFVQADDYLDHFVCLANIENIHRKYEQFKPKNKFKVWLTDHENNPIDVTDYKLTLELLLEY